MKTTSHSILIMACLALFLSLAGCDRYRVTLNERTISQPPGTLSSVEVADAALQACIEQTLADRKITSTDELQTLVCTHGGIKSLDGIQIFSKLHTLNLGNNSLTSIAPLLFLGSLASVNLEENNQLDCAEIASLREHLPAQGQLIVPEHCT